MKKVFLTFVSIFILFAANAQDFNTYLSYFKTTELPFKIDRATLNWCRLNQKQLKPISKEDLQKFILVEPSDKSQSYTFFNTTENSDVTAQKGIQFYYFKKLNLSPKFISVIIYFINEVDKNGLREWKMVLMNYTTEGKLMNCFDLAYEEIFMTYRLHLAEISKDLKVKIEEIDFESRQNSKKPNYITDFYYKIDTQNAELIFAQREYYPYEGTFTCEDKILSIEQNKELFMVMEGNANESVFTSVNLLKYDLNVGEFTFEDNQKIKWQGKFSEDKNSIKLAKAIDKSVFIFKRKY